MRHSIHALWMTIAFVFAASPPAYATDTSAEAGEKNAITTNAPDQTGSNEAAPEDGAKPVCTQCGTIVRIESRTKDGKATGIGAATGAVLGAVAGREIVHGSRGSRNTAAVVGAVGGGYAGHKIEENVRTENYYLVSVEMESDERIEVVKIDSIEGWAAGDKVRIVEGELIRR